MDILGALFLSAATLAGWWIGALKHNAQLWIRVGVAPATIWLGFYFLVQLLRAEAEIVTGTAEVGWPTLPCMVGGVWALLAKPKTDDGDHQHHQDGAAAC